MTASADISLRLNIRPLITDPVSPQLSAGMTATEGFALEALEGESFFARVCYPENVDYDSSGTMGAADAHYLGEFPAFANLGSGTSVPVQDWDGQELSLSSLRLVAVRIQRRVQFTGVKASGVLTTNGTQPADASTVVIGAKTYTFKNTLTPTEGQVKIGADALATLGNLVKAINASGVDGVDYSIAAPNAQVTASAVVGSGTEVTARHYGEAGNAIVTTSSSLTLTWAAATLEDGADVSDPPALRPLEGTVSVTLTNDLLPGTSTCNFQTSSPGVFILGTEDSWTPGATAEILISYATDKPAPATNEDINAIATVFLIGTP